MQPDPKQAPGAGESGSPLTPQDLAWKESGRSALDELFEAVDPRDGSMPDQFAAGMLASHAWAEVKRLRAAVTQSQPESDSALTEYSPAYQDEYQRLWHEAARERDQLKASIGRIRAAAESDAELDESGGLKGFLVQECIAAVASTQPNQGEDR